MARPIVIIHGWSDSFRSFKPLARKLKDALGQKVKLINLANYESRDDQVNYDDVVNAMNEAWSRAKLPRSPASVDVVVHSTGGLVIRDWLLRHFSEDPTKAPVKHLVMLAPANFGSHLAHKGRAFFGRVFKGWDSKKMFQTGEQILKGLELASPYTWNLAMRDRFAQRTFYGEGRVLCTVLVGNTGYSGISGAANEDGSDGTVRVAGANMNCMRIEADFQDPEHPSFRSEYSRGKTAFGVITGENHASITAKRKPNNENTLHYIKKALTVADRGFASWCTELDEVTADVMKNGADDNYTHGYQNTLFFVRDQFGHHVRDYFLEFYIEDDDTGWLEEFFHRDAIRTVHAYGDDNAYRSVMVDCTVLHRQIDKIQERMEISLTAMPQIGDKEKVGYNLYGLETRGIKIPRDRIRRIFKPNRTVLVDILLRREQEPDLFSLHES